MIPYDNSYNKGALIIEKVAVILTQGFADWEYGLLAGLGTAYYGIDIEFFAPKAGEVQSLGGLCCTISQELEGISEWSPKAIIVVGGSIWETENAPDISNLLKMQHKNGGIVAGICGGTLALARAELLNEALHTSHNVDFLSKNAKCYKGSAFFQEATCAVSDKLIITAAGTAPVSFTAEIFKKIGLDQDTVLQFQKMMACEHI